MTVSYLDTPHSLPEFLTIQDGQVKERSPHGTELYQYPGGELAALVDDRHFALEVYMVSSHDRENIHHVALTKKEAVQWAKKARRHGVDDHLDVERVTILACPGSKRVYWTGKNRPKARRAEQSAVV